MLDFVERVVEKFNVDENKDRVSVVQYSRDPSADFFLNTYKTQQNVVDGIRGLRHKGGRPLNTGVALQYVKDNIFTASSGNDNRRDIVFLLDGSDDSQRGFPDIQDFVQRILVNLNIDGNKDHVSVVQYSNTAEINFSLASYSTKDEVLDAIRGLRHKGGYPHNIGAALQYVRDHVFTPASGSRLLEGVPQILILLSGGRSGDDIRIPVRKLKEIGVISIGIGTTDADTLELQTISHEPNYALSITDYEHLPTAQQHVLSLLKEASHHIEPAAPTKDFGKMFPVVML
uniref:collagen alpha-3(VI) chain-like n=1 Tax=Centroberyx gerrardi TaxID=166262 RepID=UPI003AAB3A0D